MFSKNPEKIKIYLFIINICFTYPDHITKCQKKGREHRGKLNTQDFYHHVTSYLWNIESIFVLEFDTFKIGKYEL